MAIQLNDRDHLIFKFLEEHHVLLEKHISYFISSEAKPVLIRDRLRKLFYLDYLLCQRHATTLPWWTTPTKPLVYTLAPMSRDLVGGQESELDLNDSEIQRHLLEIANLRMLFMIDAKDGLISDLEWTTCNRRPNSSQHLDAKLSFVQNGITHKIGVLNHPGADSESLLNRIESALAEADIETILIVSRDEAHQQSLQQCITDHIGTGSVLNHRLAFATHQELYKAGVVKSRFQNVEQRQVAMFVDCLPEHNAKTSFGGGFGMAQAAMA